MKDLINKAVEILYQSKNTIALTGAGISVESGIPDFRSAGGLWSIYDPSDYATIDAFLNNPEKVWDMLRAMDKLVSKAKPNRAHIGMGYLERMGYLKCIITQNVDNLHQAGGARNVIEYHGNHNKLICLKCGKRYTMDEKRNEFTPRCECGSILKPEVIFFGEAIPQAALYDSMQLANSAQALMIVGTSAAVSPANSIPIMAKKNGAKIIEINKESTYLTSRLTDLFLQGDAGDIIEKIVNVIKEDD
ncbi:MAG: NAD-dependent deacylase [Deltaproteobacteria bacterium]|nr:NAD-dependent deacylase [Deltaproteobacteria bacterium]